MYDNPCLVKFGLRVGECYLLQEIAHIKLTGDRGERTPAGLAFLVFSVPSSAHVLRSGLGRGCRMSNSLGTAVFATACTVLLVLVSASRPVTTEVQPMPWCSACEYWPAMRLHTLLGWVWKATKPTLTPQPLCG